MSLLNKDQLKALADFNEFASESNASNPSHPLPEEREPVAPKHIQDWIIDAAIEEFPGYKEHSDTKRRAWEEGAMALYKYLNVAEIPAPIPQPVSKKTDETLYQEWLNQPGIEKAPPIPESLPTEEIPEEIRAWIEEKATERFEQFKKRIGASEESSYAYLYGCRDLATDLYKQLASSLSSMKAERDNALNDRDNWQKEAFALSSLLEGKNLEVVQLREEAGEYRKALTKMINAAVLLISGEDSLSRWDDIFIAKKEAQTVENKYKKEEPNP